MQATPDLISLNPVTELDTSEQELLAWTWILLDSKAGEVRIVRSVAEATEIVSALRKETHEGVECNGKQRTAWSSHWELETSRLVFDSLETRRSSLTLI